MQTNSAHSFEDMAVIIMRGSVYFSAAGVVSQFPHVDGFVLMSWCWGNATCCIGLQWISESLQSQDMNRNMCNNVSLYCYLYKAYVVFKITHPVFCQGEQNVEPFQSLLREYYLVCVYN